MLEKALAQGLDPPEPCRSGERGSDDDVLVDLLRRLDRRELELLLGAEVCEQPALAHADVAGQARDRQPLDAVGRGQPGGGVEDRSPASLAVGAAAADGFGRGRVGHCLTR